MKTIFLTILLAFFTSAATAKTYIRDEDPVVNARNYAEIETYCLSEVYMVTLAYTLRFEKGETENNALILSTTFVSNGSSDELIKQPRYRSYYINAWTDFVTATYRPKFSIGNQTFDQFLERYYVVCLNKTTTKKYGG